MAKEHTSMNDMIWNMFGGEEGMASMLRDVQKMKK